MSEDLTLYRGTSGTPYVVDFRCAHRLTQLNTGWVEGENIRCRYHGWMYDGAGQCVQQPAEPEPFCERIRIRSFPVEEYLGLVFVYLGEGDPPPLPRFPEMEDADEYQVSLHYRGCNFFNNMDNSLDEVHSSFAHWNRRVPLMEQVFPIVSAEETDYGLIRYGKRNDEVRVVHFHMPNIHHLGEASARQSIHWRVPVDDFDHMIPTSTRLAPDTRRGWGMEEENPLEMSREIFETGESIRRGRLTVEELDVDRLYIPITDDVTQLGQGIIADRQHERLGRSDAALIVLRKLWERELRALAEGRPLKQWTRPESELISRRR
jgi:5,5'-dehydrodivanillate O-demethylase